MTLTACAEITHRGDPERFRAAMSCPPAAREVLFPLYAFNVEVARAPYVASEPMIAEMRLQWWRDALDEIGSGKTPRAHEVVGPLAELIRTHDLDVKDLDRSVAARRWDVWDEPFADTAALLDHMEATASPLAWASARALGARADQEEAVRKGARAAGLARWFLAVPDLVARGKAPLPDVRPEVVADLASQALDDLRQARRAIRGGGAAMALRHGWIARDILKRASRQPERVMDGQLAPSEFRNRFLLGRVALTGGW